MCRFDPVHCCCCRCCNLWRNSLSLAVSPFTALSCVLSACLCCVAVAQVSVVDGKPIVCIDMGRGKPEDLQASGVQLARLSGSAVPACCRTCFPQQLSCVSMRCDTCFMDAAHSIHGRASCLQLLPTTCPLAAALLPACSPACLHACLPVRPPARLSLCLSLCLSFPLSLCLSLSACRQLRRSCWQRCRR